MKLAILTLTVLAFAMSVANCAEPREKNTTADATATDGKKEARSQNGRSLPFRAKVTAVDEAAATFSSAGKAGTTNLFAITEKTTITKDGKPAIFSDLAVGNVVTGVRSRTLGGKWEVASLNIQGLEAAPKTRGAKKEAAKPAEKKPEDPKPAQTEITPAPESTKPAEPKADAKPEEKKVE